MKKDYDLRKKVRVGWTCDKKGCGHLNIRELPSGYVILEDVCDSCMKLLHEPIPKRIKD